MLPERPPISFSDLAEPGRIVLPPRNDPAYQRLLADYRPWEKVRFIANDAKLDPVQAWTAVKSSRLMTYQWLELPRSEGGTFGFCAGPQLLEPLHRIDRATGGGGAASLESKQGVLHDETQRRRLHIRNLMDEAAESSLIEGAATTRRDAVEMLRAGRPPVKAGEQMVVNNYVAMQQLKRWVDRPLSMEMLLDIQTILTEKTLEDESAAGRLRRPDERVRVVDARDESVIYTPPPAEGLSRRLENVCNFANRDHRGSEFIHPIVKACILHFMIGYEHPFADGNGRTARAVFYWYALRHGYGLFEFFSISEIIRKGFSRYPQAYLHTELDDGDLTYFVLYKLDVIEQALDRFAEYLAKEEKRISQSERLLRLSPHLNLRQRLLIEHGLRHPLTPYTAKSHANSNGIALNTARSDLDDLVRQNLLVTSKRGKETLYTLSPRLEQRLAKLRH
jgi:Fic family protein